MKKLNDNLGLSTLLEEQDPNRHIRYFIFIAAAIFLAALIWAGVTNVDELTTAPGKVKPSGYAQIIKHIEGGKVEKIFKNNGDYVSEGNSILLLKQNQDVADRDTLMARKQALSLDIFRLKFLANRIDTPIDSISEELDGIQADTDSIDSMMQLLIQEISSYKEEIDILTSEVSQSSYSVAQLEKQLKNRQERVNILRNANSMYEELESTNSISKMKLIDAKEKLNETEAELLSIENSLEENRFNLENRKQELNAFKQKFKYETLEKLSKTKSNLADVIEALEHYMEQTEALNITATASGYIQDFNFSIGSIISPSEKILEIVPSDRELIVEAKIPTNHIANIKSGSPARLRVSSYNYIRYGTLSGKINSISASSFQDNTQAPPYYKAVISLDKESLDSSNIILLPGMEVTANIISGQRTILQYLLRPIIHSTSLAFREK